jgi:hypothetical protein
MTGITDQINASYCSVLQESSSLDIIRVFKKINEKLSSSSIGKYGLISNGDEF